MWWACCHRRSRAHYHGSKGIKRKSDHSKSWQRLEQAHISGPYPLNSDTQHIPHLPARPLRRKLIDQNTTPSGTWHKTSTMPRSQWTSSTRNTQKKPRMGRSQNRSITIGTTCGGLTPTSGMEGTTRILSHNYLRLLWTMRRRRDTTPLFQRKGMLQRRMQHSLEPKNGK